MSIYHLISSRSVISIIFKTRKRWIDSNDVDFDAVYPFFWFYSTLLNFSSCLLILGVFFGFFVGSARRREIRYDDDLTVFLLLRGYFFVPSLHLCPNSWLFLHWFSVLSTSWLCLFFLLLPVLLKSRLAAAALFLIRLWTVYFHLVVVLDFSHYLLLHALPLFLLFYFEWVSTIGNHPYFFLHCVTVIDKLVTSLCFSWLLLLFLLQVKFFWFY